MTSPLPCPFCGHVGVTVRQTLAHNWRAAACDGCGVQASNVMRIYNEDDPDAKCEERAIREWNACVTYMETGE